MRGLSALALCLLAAACAGIEMKPGEKPMARREIPPTPGLLTGTRGEFVIFSLAGTAEDGATEGNPAQPDGAGKVVQ